MGYAYRLTPYHLARKENMATKWFDEWNAKADVEMSWAEVWPHLIIGKTAEAAGPVVRHTQNGKGYRYYLRQQREEV